MKPKANRDFATDSTMPNDFAQPLDYRPSMLHNWPFFGRFEP